MRSRRRGVVQVHFRAFVSVSDAQYFNCYTQNCKNQFLLINISQILNVSTSKVIKRKDSKFQSNTSRFLWQGLMESVRESKMVLNAPKAKQKPGRKKYSLSDIFRVFYKHSYMNKILLKTLRSQIQLITMTPGDQ